MRSGCLLLELPGRAIWFENTRACARLEGIAFATLAHALGALARGRSADAACARLRRSGVPAEEAEELLGHFRTWLRSTRRPGPILWLRRRDLESTLTTRMRARPAPPSAAQDFGPAGLVLRIGPLAASDVRGEHPDRLVVQVTPHGWRLGTGSLDGCECPSLWDIVRSPSPEGAARVAGERAGDAYIALTTADVTRIVSAVRAALRGRLAPGWTAGRFGRRALFRESPALGCPACNGRQQPAGGPPASPDDEVSLARIAGSLVRRLGVHFRERRRGSARTFRSRPWIGMEWGVAFPRPERKRAFGVFSRTHIGSGLSVARRLLIARAQVIERASGKLRLPDVRATAPELAAPSLPLREWGLYSREQYGQRTFPYRQVDPSTKVDWVWAECLSTRERILVPLQLTYSEQTALPRFVRSTANGLATHTSRDLAIVGGLLEVIERDATIRAWYGGSGARLIETGALDLGEMTPALAWFQANGWRVFFSLMAGRGGCAVVSAIAEHQRTERPLRPGGILYAAGASRSIHRAAQHALRELQAIPECPWLGSRRILAERVFDVPVDFADYWRVDDVVSILKLYLRPEMRPAVDLFLQGPPLRGPWHDAPDDLPALAAALDRERLRPLVVEMSIPATRPFVTVQVIVPGTQPLSFGAGDLRLGTGLLPTALPQQARAFPERGYRPARGAINPYPLPFA